MSLPLARLALLAECLGLGRRPLARRCARPALGRRLAGGGLARRRLGALRPLLPAPCGSPRSSVGAARLATGLDEAVAVAPPSSAHLPDSTRCAASATASAISEPSFDALVIIVVAAWLALSAASSPWSICNRRKTLKKKQKPNTLQ